MMKLRLKAEKGQIGKSAQSSGFEESARLLMAAKRTGDKYGHHHDGGEIDVDEQELQDMEALNKSLS